VPQQAPPEPDARNEVTRNKVTRNEVNEVNTNLKPET
jgi:hypothetical protein